MSTPLLVGLFGAWTAVQIALGGFFLQAFFARRREAEYLLFGLVCFALAVTDAGLTLGYAATGFAQWSLAIGIAHVGALVGTALVVHFTWLFVAAEGTHRLIPTAYAAAAAYSVLVLSGGWWEPGSYRAEASEFLGIHFHQVSATPTLAAVSGYVIFLAANVACVAVLVTALRQGRREVRGALVGLCIVIGCAMSDMLAVTGKTNLPALLPYGFLIYGFGVADTLLVRYRRAADELETTANELRRATEELTNSYLELSVVQEELFKKRQLASVGELAASIAHEVRNPLAVIVNAAATLKRTAVGPDDRNTLFGIIEEEITRLNGLVTELLRYARPMNVRREDVSLSEVLKAVSERLSDKHSFDMELENDPEVEMVWADPNLLRLALTNLVDNARQAMPEGGAVVVVAAKDRIGSQSAVRIEVSDTGQGMDSKTLSRALDPFFTTRPSGAGLGLPIAGRIAEAHEGRVEMRSRPGEGTTVTLFIPTKRAERHSEPRLVIGPRA